MITSNLDTSLTIKNNCPWQSVLHQDNYHDNTAKTTTENIEKHSVVILFLRQLLLGLLCCSMTNVWSSENHGFMIQSFNMLFIAWKSIFNSIMRYWTFNLYYVIGHSSNVDMNDQISGGHYCCIVLSSIQFEFKFWTGSIVSPKLFIRFQLPWL